MWNEMNRRAKKEDSVLSGSIARRKKSDVFRVVSVAWIASLELYRRFHDLSPVHILLGGFSIQPDDRSKLDFQMDSLPQWMAKARAFQNK